MTSMVAAKIARRTAVHCGAPVICCVVTLAILGAYANGADGYEVTIERGLTMKTRDGVTLRADVCRPKADGKFPVLLTRTPYDKNGVRSFCQKAAARGYVVIAQDVRGRYSSEGDWYPFKFESQDGYDTVEWAAALPYANGKVGMFGGSYVGATQFLAAIAQPPHLAGICPNYTASNYHDGWTYQGGAFEQWFNETWTSGLAFDTLGRLAENASSSDEWKQKLPLLSYPVLKMPSSAALAPYFVDWLLHPDYDDYWKRWSIEDHYSQIRVPVFSMGAWYDIFLGGTLRNFERLRKEAGTESARCGQRLWVYVGGHAGGWNSRKVGAVDFGEKLSFDLDDVMLRWYDHLLKGVANGIEQEKPVRIFVMGKNDWREEEDFPLQRATPTRYYLHSSKAANGALGGGTLSTALPAEEPADHYIYDPENAVPTIGGPLCCEALATGIGPEDQRPAETRDDVLVFSTSVFTQNTEVTGPVQLDLYVSTSALDTDFTGKLVDVWPDGFAQNLTEGILRLRYRNSEEKPELANPGQVYHIHLDLWATSNVFLPGHKLRLEVSSSNFPRFDRNLNTGDDQARGTQMVRATNVIYHDKIHSSALILPVVQ